MLMWLPIKGYEGIYEVSNDGQVKSLERETWYGYGYMTHKERILKATPGKSGYVILTLSYNGARKKQLLHRILAETFIPNPKGLPHVNHIDGNKSNNSLDNLEWCTHSENIQHSFDTGLSPRGEGHGLSKISEEQALEVLNLMDEGKYPTQISRETGIKYSTVHGIYYGENWSWLRDNRKVKV